MARKKKRAATDGQHSPVAFVTPMAAQNVEALPSGEEWLYELKIDGYRALLMKDGARVEIRSRRDNELTRTYPGVADAVLRVNANQVVLDGEIVAVDTPAGKIAEDEHTKMVSRSEEDVLRREVGDSNLIV